MTELYVRAAVKVFVALTIIAIVLHQPLLHWRTIFCAALVIVVQTGVFENEERRRRQAAEQDAIEKIALKLDRSAVQVWNGKKKS
jgi:hypothetical protein